MARHQNKVPIHIMHLAIFEFGLVVGPIVIAKRTVNEDGAFLIATVVPKGNTRDISFVCSSVQSLITHCHSSCFARSFFAVLRKKSRSSAAAPRLWKMNTKFIFGCTSCHGATWRRCGRARIAKQEIAAG
jgi:hypothetical protein